MILRTTILIGLSAGLLYPAPKNRDWQAGVLLDADHNSYFAHTSPPRSPTSAFVAEITQSGMRTTNESTAANFVLDEYVIDSGAYVYLVHVMRVKGAKPLQLSANMQVKFAVDKKKLWLLAPDGHELQTTVANQRLKSQALR
jgi:hypothetical protein